MENSSRQLHHKNSNYYKDTFDANEPAEYLGITLLLSIIKVIANSQAVTMLCGHSSSMKARDMKQFALQYKTAKMIKCTDFR